MIHFPAPGYLDAWINLENIKQLGLAKSIGVSNFSIDHLKNILKNGNVVPAVNQIEVHPLLQHRAIRNFHDEFNIATQAWGPLGQGFYNIEKIPGIINISKKYGKSVYQIILRWHIQERNIVFPKTSRKEKLFENISIFDFKLNKEEMETIGKIGKFSDSSL